MSHIPVTLTAKNQLTPITCEFVFSLPSGQAYSFRPGQYTWLILPTLSQNKSEKDRNAFSIASPSQNKDSISIIARSGSSTYKQTLFSLEIGSTAEITLAAGAEFVIENNVSQPLCFVAGGVGVSPFLSHLRSQTSPASQPQTLIFINRTQDRAFLIDEITALCQKTQTKLVIHYGEISPELFPAETKSEQVKFFVSGSQRFVNVTAQLMQSLSIATQSMHFEQYYPVCDQRMVHFFSEFLNHSEVGITNPFRLLVENNSMHLVVTDANGKIIFANAAAQRVTGYLFHEMQGHTPRLWGGLMGEEFYAKLWHHIKIDKKPFVGEITNRKKTGEVYVSLARITPIIQDQMVIGFVASEEDITHRVAMERQLAYKKAQHEAMLASIGEGLIAFDKQGRVMLTNTLACDLLKLTPEELQGQLFTEFVEAEDKLGNPIQPTMRPLALVIESQQRMTQTLWYRRKDGQKFAAKITLSPFLIDNQVAGVIQVFRDVTEDVRIDTMKTEFISLASHQLRTPLSSIRWYLEMLLDGDAGEINEEQRKFAQEAYQGAERMALLVSALLSVARIESGSYMIEPVPTNLVQLVRSVLDELKVQTDQKNLKVHLEKENIPEIPLDPELFRIVIHNLLTNAIKYSNNAGSIVVRLKQVTSNDPLLEGQQMPFDPGILFQVSDSGIGIPQDEQQQIFSKLYRASNVIQTETEGTGLGLYIVRNIIVDANGKIWFTSVEGKGTTVSILLPLTGMKGRSGTKKLT